MSGNQGEVDLTFRVFPSFAQVEVRDKDNVNVPDWETGEEAVVYSESMVSIATRPDSDGEVVIRVVSNSVAEFEGGEVFSGVLSLPSGVLVVGNTISEDLREIDLIPARSVRMSVLIDPPFLPHSVTVVLRGES